MQLYAALLYCVGMCPTSAPPPDGLILYGNLASCMNSSVAKFNPRIRDSRTGQLVPYEIHYHCAKIYIDDSFWCEMYKAAPTIFKGADCHAKH